MTLLNLFIVKIIHTMKLLKNSCIINNSIYASVNGDDFFWKLFHIISVS